MESVPHDKVKKKVTVEPPLVLLSDQDNPYKWATFIRKTNFNDFESMSKTMLDENNYHESLVISAHFDTESSL